MYHLHDIEAPISRVHIHLLRIESREKGERQSHSSGGLFESSQSVFRYRGAKEKIMRPRG